MPKQFLKLDEYNPSYDIPDDPRPVSNYVENNPNSDLSDDILYKEEMVSHIKKLRERAMRLRSRQNHYWESFGDNYNLEELAEFIYTNREYIVGIVKDARWLATASRYAWEDNFSAYYQLLMTFIERSKYVISSYETQIKKLSRKAKGL